MKIHATDFLLIAIVLVIIAVWLYVSILNIANYHKYKAIPPENSSSSNKEVKASGIKRFCLYLLCKLKQIKNGKSRRNQG